MLTLNSYQALYCADLQGIVCAEVGGVRGAEGREKKRDLVFLLCFNYYRREKHDKICLEKGQLKIKLVLEQICFSKSTDQYQIRLKSDQVLQLTVLCIF